MRWNYVLHLLWILGVVLLQWGIAPGILRRNLRTILLPALILGTYYSAADTVAIREGIWHFDPRQLTGLSIGPVPIEEILFFYLTALLVAQSLVMLLPDRFRR